MSSFSLQNLDLRQAKFLKQDRHFRALHAHHNHTSRKIEARCRSGHAAARSERRVFTSTLVSDVRFYGRTQCNDHAWKRSGATSRTASTRPNFMAGSAKSRDSKSALLA